MENENDLIALFPTLQPCGVGGVVDPDRSWLQWTDMTTGSSKDGSTEGKRYAYRYWPKGNPNWPTTTLPKGHNGTHAVRLYSVNGNPAVTSINVEHYANETWSTLMQPPPNDTQPVAVKAKCKTVEVKNLVITDVRTNVNEDYFVFDPDSADPVRQEPQLQFTIEDDGDPHEYKWIIYIEPTSTDAYPSEPQHLAYLSGTTTGPGTVSVTWNGQQNNNTGSLMERGTYTFDIYVDEVENAADPNSPVLDEMEMKTPYCLSMSAHSFEFRVDADDQERAYGSYTLADGSDQNPASVWIDVLDPDFNLKATQPGPGVVVNTAYENIRLYTLTDDDPSGEWRVVFMAIDEHADRTRDHQGNRMLAVNGRRKPKIFMIEEDKMSLIDSGGAIMYPYAFSQALKTAFERAGWHVGPAPTGAEVISVLYLGSGRYQRASQTYDLSTQGGRTSFSTNTFQNYGERNKRRIVHVIGAGYGTAGEYGWSLEPQRYSYTFVMELGGPGQTDPIKKTTIHEVGHQFGLGHHPVTDWPATRNGKLCVMGEGFPSATTDFEFCETWLNHTSHRDQIWGYSWED